MMTNDTANRDPQGAPQQPTTQQPITQPNMQPQAVPQMVQPPPQQPAFYAAPPPPPYLGAAPKQKRSYLPAEKLLLPIALIIGVLFDRLMFTALLDGNKYAEMMAGAFWLAYIVLFYAFYWKKLRYNRVLWYVSGCCAALCVWNFLLSHGNENGSFTALSQLVIPAVLMAHAQYAAGEYKLKDVGKIAISWLLGWFYRPFSGIGACFGAMGALFSGENKSAVKKVIIGVAVTLPLLCILLPLLSGADRVFGYYLRAIVGDWSFSSVIGHTIIVFIAFGLFYSFLWNVGFGKKDAITERPKRTVDPIISCIVLASVCALYALFCGVQFTYLFARMGLPVGMTYAEYAREGFAQTVTVCALNLLIFAIILHISKKKKVVSALLFTLLGLTGAMLFSGFVRLGLYISAYGLTWLRLLSGWFVIYLAIVIVLCAVRMLREKLPAIALCALILLGWFVMLGYSNPDKLVRDYNMTYSYDAVEI